MDTTDQVSSLIYIIEQALAGNYNAAGAAIVTDEVFLPLYQRIIQIIDEYKKCNFEIQNTVSQVLSATEDLSLTLEENAAYSKELYDRSYDLLNINTQSNRSTQSAIQQIKDFIGHIDSIRQASDKSKETNLKTKAAIDCGMDRVRQTTGFISQMENMNSQTVEYVREFIASTSRISEVVSIVENLTKKMEIIALNAIVESKRAGMEGRSFGVIASAFRDLADQSKQRVMDIYEVNSNIHNESKRLEVMMERNMMGVKQCAANAVRIEEDLNDVEISYHEVSGMIDVIYQDVGAQSCAAESISQNIYY